MLRVVGTVTANFNATQSNKELHAPNKHSLRRILGYILARDELQLRLCFLKSPAMRTEFRCGAEGKQDLGILVWRRLSAFSYLRLALALIATGRILLGPRQLRYWQAISRRRSEGQQSPLTDLLIVLHCREWLVRRPALAKSRLAANFRYGPSLTIKWRPNQGRCRNAVRPL